MSLSNSISLRDYRIDPAANNCLGGAYVEIQPGFYAAIVDTEMQSEISYTASSFRMASISVLLSGRIATEVDSIRDLSSGSALLASTSEEAMWRSRVGARSRLRTAGVFVTPRWFAENEAYLHNDSSFDELYETLNQPLRARQIVLTRELAADAEAMLSPDGTGGLSCALQFEARSLDMLVALAGLSTQRNEACSLRTTDRDRVSALRSQLRMDPCSMPSLSEIARRYGVSASKLKRDYRACFGSCLSADIMAARLDVGYGLLAEGARVSEVAYRLGYYHPTNFATAFRKKFGIPPKLVKPAKTRRFE